MDTEGYAIKGGGVGHVNAELVEEANRTRDMFETDNYGRLDEVIQQDEDKRYEDAIRGMQDEIIKKNEKRMKAREELEADVRSGLEGVGSEFDPSVVVMPELLSDDSAVENSRKGSSNSQKKEETKMPNPSIIELANNPDYSVATIAKEANRINERENGEVFISLR